MDRACAAAAAAATSCTFSIMFVPGLHLIRFIWPQFAHLLDSGIRHSSDKSPYIGIRQDQSRPDWHLLYTQWQNLPTHSHIRCNGSCEATVADGTLCQQNFHELTYHVFTVLRESFYDVSGSIISIYPLSPTGHSE